MASAQWLLNDTSVTSGSYWTAESGSSYKLKNVSGSTWFRTTSSPTPYEGAGCYTGAGSNYLAWLRTSADAEVTGVNYEDYYFYRTNSNLTICGITYNDSTVEYSYVQFNTNNTFSIVTFDAGLGETYRTTSGAVVPSGSWFRIQVKRAATGITEVKLFKDSDINGTTPAATITWTPTYSNYQYTSTGSGGFGWIDNIKFDDTAYPTRAVVVTAAAAGSATATGTAAMSNARVGAGTGTGTATGTGAASRGQSVTGSASVTASGTAAMSSTQAMSASGSVTASGTAAMSRTQVIGGSGTGTGTGTANGSTTGIVTFGGTGTGTASGTGNIEKVTNLYRSGEVYRNVSLYPASIDLVTAGGTATGTATGTGGVEKVTNPYRFGNVYRNAGTYPGGAALVGCDPSTIVAAGSAAMTKTRYLEATATATATSQAGMTHTFYVFKPPTREISPLSLDPYYQLVGYFQGRTLVKRDGVWKVVQNRQEDWLDQCEYVFKGGRENRINGTEKAELESAGYTVETRTS
jgi:hypothetical protein